MTMQKGVMELVRSAKLLLEKVGDVHYVIAGDLQPQSWMDRSAEVVRHFVADDRFLASHFSFVGQLDPSSLRSLYKRATLALVPSIYEPFGYAALEAMREGVAVIAADCGGLREIVTHNVSGFLVPVVTDEHGAAGCDVRKLAEAQAILLQNEELRKALARNGKQRSTLFSAEAMAASTAAVYRDVLRVSGASVRTKCALGALT